MKWSTRHLRVALGALLLGGALGCGAETEPVVVEREPVTELPARQSLLDAAAPPPSASDAGVDAELDVFTAWGYLGDSGRVNGRALLATGMGEAWSRGFLLKEGRVYFHPRWEGCTPAPSACAMGGAVELSVLQMERLLPRMQARAQELGPLWAMASELVTVLQRSIATWRGESLPAEVRLTFREALPDFIPWAYGYRKDAAGADVLLVSGNPADLGFLLKDGRVYFHDRWHGCTPDVLACQLEGATPLTLEELQLLLPVLEARAAALGDTWVLARVAVDLVRADIAAAQQR